ncbi:hypothetical protein ABIB40_002630 [Pedobacter sp. UYP30]|uniref:nuclear transport factor 2 family protein n=1 Tax=Pedobacter sp. UYP30 TaxID=1756400 RepID=UPI003394B661
MTTKETKHTLAKTFQKALTDKNWDLMSTIMSPEVSWTLPGSNKISGKASGIDAVINRAHLIASYGLSFELLNVLVSKDNMALSLHNTAKRGALVLDEYLATVCEIKKDRIVSIETYLSDLDGMNAFFEDLP